MNSRIVVITCCGRITLPCVAFYLGCVLLRCPFTTRLSRGFVHGVLRGVLPSVLGDEAVEKWRTETSNFGERRAKFWVEGDQERKVERRVQMLEKVDKGLEDVDEESDKLLQQGTTRLMHGSPGSKRIKSLVKVTIERARAGDSYVVEEVVEVSIFEDDAPLGSKPRFKVLGI